MKAVRNRERGRPAVHANAAPQLGSLDEVAPCPADAWTCPISLRQYPEVTLAHGDGGRLTHELVSELFVAAFGGEHLRRAHDGALLDLTGGRTAFTTDSYVVRPLFFPGGDIGSLAVHGTVNDLAMCGARPRFLSVGFLLEEGLPMATLWRIVSSMAAAARACGVEIVTGDTKVVDHGKGDGVYINTAGVGVLEHDVEVGPQAVQPGDLILLSGDPGRHGLAVLATREGLSFDEEIASDAASVAAPALALLDDDIEVHCLRDATRGGLATALVEIAETARLSMRIEEEQVPIAPVVRGGCELLGLDPLYLACEGRFVAIVPERHVDAALHTLARYEVSAGARAIGEVGRANTEGVCLRTVLGTERVIERLSGASLPRIC